MTKTNKFEFFLLKM